MGNFGGEDLPAPVSKLFDSLGQFIAERCFRIQGTSIRLTVFTDQFFATPGHRKANILPSVVDKERVGEEFPARSPRRQRRPPRQSQLDSRDAPFSLHQ